MLCILNFTVMYLCMPSKVKDNMISLRGCPELFASTDFYYFTHTDFSSSCIAYEENLVVLERAFIAFAIM